MYIFIATDYQPGFDAINAQVCVGHYRGLDRQAGIGCTGCGERGKTRWSQAGGGGGE